jgi:hypothetical protein
MRSPPESDFERSRSESIEKAEPDKTAIAGDGSRARRGFETHRKRTRRGEFLDTNAIVPWAELCAVVEPHY